MAELPPRPVALKVKPENIPAELKALRIWVCWHYEWNGKRWTKVPYIPFEAGKAASTRPSTWRTFEQAYTAYLEKRNFFDGIFAALSDKDPYSGGDFDHCTDTSLVPQTYAEYSPSGEGIRFIGRGTIPSACTGQGRELYTTRRFLSITGHRLEGFPKEIRCVQEDLDRLYELFKSEGKPGKEGKPGNGDRAAHVASHTDAEWQEARRQQRVNISLLLGELNRRSVNNKTGRRDTQLAYLLRGDHRGFHNKWPYVGIVKGDGSIDQSQIRAVMANSIKGRGFPFPEFVALMSHFYGRECLTKWGFNKHAVQEEFATLWYVSRTPRTGEYKSEVQPVKRGRGSDHSILLERAYQALEDHKAGAQAFITQQVLADYLGVNRRTAISLMQELRDQHRITYVAMRNNAGIVVSFGGGVINAQDEDGDKGQGNELERGSSSLDISAPPPSEGVINPDDEIAFVDAQNGDEPSFISADFLEAEMLAGVEGVINQNNPTSECSHTDTQNEGELVFEERGTNPPISNNIYINPVSLSADTITPPNSLPALARDYLDHPAEAVGERLVNADTGAITYRRSAKHFAQLVQVDGAEAAYRAEQARREKEASDAWKRFFASLRRMSDEELIAYIGGGCRRSVAELAREGATFDQHVYKTRLKCAKQQLEWRGLKMPGRETKQKAVTPRKKEKGVAVEQVGFLAEETNTTPVSSPQAQSLIERLKARQAHSEDTRGVCPYA